MNHKVSVMRQIFMFPGQGSQSKGMGFDLFEQFSQETQEASDILGYCIKTLCLDDPNEELNRTQFTQPALYMVNALSMMKLAEDGVVPDMVLGHSLGEYNALLAAGVFDFETGLKLVQKRGALMAQASEGGMAAVIGLTREQVAEVLSDNALDSIDLANHNAHLQVVLSGMAADIQAAIPVFEQAGAKRVIPLAVSGAFHSRYMKHAQEEFLIFLDRVDFKDPSLPVISNVTAKPYELSSMKENLAQQLLQLVRWVESMIYVLEHGDVECREVGPGKVLAGLLKRLK